MPLTADIAAGVAADGVAATPAERAVMADFTPAPAAVALPVGREGRRRVGAWWPALGAWAIGALVIYLSPAAGHLNPYLTLTGVLVGFLVGLTGMGGGALMTPILILLFGFAPTLAVGTDITYAAITKVFGSWRHLTQKSVDRPLALWLALGSVPAGLAGASAVHAISERGGDVVDVVLYRTIGVALIVVGVLLVVRLLMKMPVATRTTNLPMSTRRKVMTVAIGATAGFIIGLTSVGSGTLLAMFLILLYPIAASRIVGTDVFHATILLGATSLAQLHYGNVDTWMVASLVIGSVPGVIAGSHLTVRTPTKALRVCLAVVLLLSGIAMITRG